MNIIGRKEEKLMDGGDEEKEERMGEQKAWEFKEEGGEG